MSDKTEKTMARARKLLAVIENAAATEGEVFAASAALQRLLKEAGMTVADIEATGTAPEVTSGEAEDVARMEPWRGSIAVTVARAYRCEVYTKGYIVGRAVNGRSINRSRIMFMGYPSDVELATRVYVATLAAAENCWKAEAAQVREEVRDRYYDPDDPQVARWVKGDVARRKRSFLGGFAYGLTQAYLENVAADGELALAVTIPGAVREEFGKMNLVNRKTRYRGYGYSDCYQRGSACGHGVGMGDRLSA